MFSNLPPPTITKTLSQSLKQRAMPFCSNCSVVFDAPRDPDDRTLIININEISNGIAHQINAANNKRDFFLIIAYSHTILAARFRTERTNKIQFLFICLKILRKFPKNGETF